MTHDPWDDEERALLDGLHDALDEVRQRHAGDPPLDVLSAADADALPEAWQSGVRAHLAQSRWSRAIVAGSMLPERPLSDLDEARLLRRVKHGAGRARRVGALLLGGALAASLLVAMALWPRVADDDRGRSPFEDAGETRVARSEPTTTLPLLDLEPPPLQAPLSALTLRGEAEAAEKRDAARNRAYVDLLAPAFDAYRAGDFQAADLAFGDAAAQFPTAFEVLYYGGISRLMLGRTSTAVDALEDALAQAAPDRRAEVAWYSAVALQRAGRDEDALARLRTLCETGGGFGRRACAAVETAAAAGSTP